MANRWTSLSALKSTLGEITLACREALSGERTGRRLAESNKLYKAIGSVQNSSGAL